MESASESGSSDRVISRRLFLGILCVVIVVALATLFIAPGRSPAFPKEGKLSITVSSENRFVERVLLSVLPDDRVNVTSEWPIENWLISTKDTWSGVVALTWRGASPWVTVYAQAYDRMQTVRIQLHEGSTVSVAFDFI